MPLWRVFLSPHALAEDHETPVAPRIGFFPTWFAPQLADVRLTGFVMTDEAVVPALPPALEVFLNDGARPVIFTPGSFMRQAKSFFEESLAVCERLKLRAIFLTPHSDQLPASLPPGVRHFPFIFTAISIEFISSYSRVYYISMAKSTESYIIFCRRHSSCPIKL